MKFGIGFVTGRKNFKNVLRTYMNSYWESSLNKEKVSLNLFIAYDLGYTGTKWSDYRIPNNAQIPKVDNVCYISKKNIMEEIARLTTDGILSRKEAELLFGEGYGKKRNIIMYFALRNNIDYLLFIDDDEYPIAPVRIKNNKVIWKGQDVIGTHLRFIREADITNGFHCGYISPIPRVEYNRTLSEADYRLFIEALSNDILNWESISSKLKDGGITYADPHLLEQQNAQEVPEQNGTKFISGSNLCLNLTVNNIDNIPPFFNPPKARGEDTFFSTCLGGARVARIPCYTFHDGFQNYNCLLNGVLPLELKKEKTLSTPNVLRFLNAAIGWSRYKPLLLFITRRKDYDYMIKEAREKLVHVIPKFCRYFKMPDFEMILKEFDYYHKYVEQHFMNFEETKVAWKKVVNFARQAEPLAFSSTEDKYIYSSKSTKEYDASILPAMS